MAQPSVPEPPGSATLVRESPDTPPQPDWPAQATRTVVEVVDKVRDRTSGPARTAVAGAVYGMVAAAAMTMLGILLVVAAVRGLELLLWEKVWLAYLILGGLFSVIGLVCWAKRPRTKPNPAGGAP